MHEYGEEGESGGRFRRPRQGRRTKEPEDARSLSDVVAPVTGDMKVLSYDASQEKIPLFGNVFLSGIGWIDGQLHVQLYVQQPVLNKGYGMSAYGAVDGENVQADVGMISWDEWSEYVFNCDPDDVDRMTLETHLTEYEESLYDDWSVEIPMNMLLRKDAAESTAPIRPTIAESANCMTTEETCARIAGSARRTVRRTSSFRVMALPDLNFSKAVFSILCRFMPLSTREVSPTCAGVPVQFFIISQTELFVLK